MLRFLKYPDKVGNPGRTTIRTLSAACGAGTAVVGLILAAAGCGSPQSPPHRIILVTIDTLRADHLATYGYPRGVSPFLDHLAGESVVFDLAFSSCPHTAPSHASLFTSLQPAQHRVLLNGDGLDDRLLTIAEVLSAQGYRTAAFSPVKFLNGLGKGFDYFGSSESYEPAGAVLARASKWLQAAGGETSSFVWIHLYDVHEWEVPSRRHRDAIRWVVENAKPQHGKLRSWLRQYQGLPVDPPEGKYPIVRTVNWYDGQLLAVDRALEEFYQRLDSLGFLDGSVWVITSDHGEGLGNHHLLGHGLNLYDEQIRVPLLFHSPNGRFEIGRVGELIRLVDVAPTLAALAGSDMQRQLFPVAGRSVLSQLLDRRTALPPVEAFIQRPPASPRGLKMGWVKGDEYGLRGAEYKLIVNTEEPCQFYDLAADPFELHNVCNPRDSELAEVIESLGSAYESMRSEGDMVHTGVAPPEVVQELKALGYLRD